jgi:hypothetical protein
MAWYKITCRCTVCGVKWVRRTKNPDSPDPACPNLACGEVPVPIGMDLSSNRAPATIGGNLRVQAIDETANIVMQDYGMTNMRDDVREGESATPRLPPAQQAMADSYFGAPKQQQTRRMGFNSRAHVAAALSGRLSDAVSTNRSIVNTHQQRIRPPVHIVNRQ